MRRAPAVVILGGALLACNLTSVLQTSGGQVSTAGTTAGTADVNLSPPAGWSVQDSGAASMRRVRARGQADVYPRGAILEAWIYLETELRRMALFAEISPQTHRTITQITKVLQQREVFSSDLSDLIFGLRTLRNKAAHDVEFDISPEKVFNYIDLSLRAAEAVRRSFPR